MGLLSAVGAWRPLPVGGRCGWGWRYGGGGEGVSVCGEQRE